MYTTQFSALLKNYFAICHKLKCTPFVYNSKTGKLQQTSSLWHIRQFRLQCVLHVLYGIAMVVNLAFGNLTLHGRLQGVGLFMMYLSVIIIRWNYFLDKAGIQVVNSFIEFERVILKGNFASSCTNPCRFAILVVMP